MFLAAAESDLSFEVKLDTVLKFWDGRYDWAQVWPGSIPGVAGGPDVPPGPSIEEAYSTAVDISKRIPGLQADSPDKGSK